MAAEIVDLGGEREVLAGSAHPLFQAVARAVRRVQEAVGRITGVGR